MQKLFLEDDKLIMAYRKLISSLDIKEMEKLKNSQRKWVDRRDEICRNLEEKSFEFYSKYNASRENETLDMCVIQLTSDRAIELEFFLKELANKKSVDCEKFTIRYENL